MKIKRILGLWLILLMLIVTACGSNKDAVNDNLPTHGNYYYDVANVVLYLEEAVQANSRLKLEIQESEA